MSPQERTASPDDLPITVSITRLVKPENIPEATRWVQAGVNLANRYDGFLGSGWVRGTADGEDWHMLYRFADRARLDAWENSAERAEWLERGRDLVVHQRTERRTGIEGWFDAPHAGEAQTPPPWKQTIAIWCGFFPVNTAFTYVISWLWPSFGLLPIWLRCLISTAILCPIMVPFVLPLVTGWLKPWLTAQPRRPSTVASSIRGA
ncbi:antibiotic biosynthesis monooxygenase [Gryllotalpicola kribbensis]|jgi:antibiotic biosynthesis monooxygenase (ABM) superfamily enzyme|uniref:Antibiotic biosynthesis monooxygenase n=1 Tax=Gryllotalpicola kribbensis TaxID=993084 RepID=A0ABP8AHQ9_9MICO